MRVFSKCTVKRPIVCVKVYYCMSQEQQKKSTVKVQSDKPEGMVKIWQMRHANGYRYNSACHSQNLKWKKPLSPDTNTKSTDSKSQLTSIDLMLVERKKKEAQQPGVTLRLTMSNHRQKLTSIDAPFSKGGGKKKKNTQRRNTTSRVWHRGLWWQMARVRCNCGVCARVCVWLGGLTVDSFTVFALTQR